MLVREGYFNPDSTRSGAWIKHPANISSEQFESEARRLDETCMFLQMSPSECEIWVGGLLAALKADRYLQPAWSRSAMPMQWSLA